MAVGLPAKTTYVDGDVFSASDINDTNGTLNLVGQTTNFYAGKNKIINGDFGVWQRGTSFTTTNFNGFVADRYQIYSLGTLTSCTTSRQTFTPGTAPVAGYESQYFLRFDQGAAGVGNTANYITQFIEDVRTFAGQTVTFSLWAKADAARSITVDYFQQFGSGGSGTVTATIGSATLTTSWARYTFTVTLPSISGKTIGAGSNLAILINLPFGTSQTIDFWGWQLESGQTATAFQTATGTIQGELAACQRYYQILGNLYGYAFSANTIQGIVSATPMRATPTATMLTTTPYAECPINVTARTGSGSTTTGSSDVNSYGSQFIRVGGFSGMTANQFAFIQSNQISLSAEL
jgi:hypothetical protein